MGDVNNRSNNTLYKEKVSLLAISYHNMGTEEEYCKHFDRAVDWFLKSYETLRDKLGEQEPMTIKFLNIFKNAQEVLTLL